MVNRRRRTVVWFLLVPIVAFLFSGMIGPYEILLLLVALAAWLYGLLVWSKRPSR